MEPVLAAVAAMALTDTDMAYSPEPADYLVQDCSSSEVAAPVLVVHHTHMSFVGYTGQPTVPWTIPTLIRNRV